MLKVIEENDDEDTNLFMTLFLLAYIVKDQDWSWEDEIQDVIDYEQYNLVREDLLHLYIYINQKQPKTSDGQKLTLKHSLGKIEIKNYYNWFTQKLLKDYLALYLADIKSVEQAEEELLKYKKRTGRRAKDPRIPIILYGIFRMFNEKKKMKSSQSDSLCAFIITYLQFLGILENDTYVDNQWIRAQITYISTKPQPPKFPHRDVFKAATPESFKNLGKRLY